MTYVVTNTSTVSNLNPDNFRGYTELDFYDIQLTADNQHYQSSNTPDKDLPWLDVATAEVTIWSGAFTIAAHNSKPLYQGIKSWTAEARLAGKVGNRLGAVGLVLTGADIAMNGVNTSNTLDAAFGTIAFFGPIGAGIAGAYFVANLITIGITGQSIGEHLQEAVIGDANASWKPWD